MNEKKEDQLIWGLIIDLNAQKSINWVVLINIGELKCIDWYVKYERIGMKWWDDLKIGIKVVEF
jgi:hypothetical protein